ncbi:tripartite tricarboxylate transporter TctB family protein [Thiolinea disciformis]|uniref:tripartite tricarboxylate transporter TctB family protein n=1 Tax=Thiolinea disciformis TaxID=125614 RepID=UPI00037B8665|nr:tripartite tricarboxylate transporter TctB family protein [Thiolinea disciformis]
MLKRVTGEQWIALGVILIGFIMIWQITGIPKSTGYAGIGPRFFPSVIAFGLVIAGATLLIQSRPSKHPETEEKTQDPDHPLDYEIAHPHWRMFSIASAALILHMSLIGFIGFTLAGTLLCFGICLALETSHKIRDLILSFLLVLGLFHLFKWLGLNLPALISGGFL